MGIWCSKIEGTDHQQACCSWAAVLKKMKATRDHNPKKNTFNHPACKCWAEPHESGWQCLAILDGCILIVFQNLQNQSPGPSLFTLCHVAPQFWPPTPLNLLTELLENFSILSAFATEEGDNGICAAKSRENHRKMIFLVGNSIWGDFRNGFHVNSGVRLATSIWVGWAFCELGGLQILACGFS